MADPILHGLAGVLQWQFQYWEVVSYSSIFLGFSIIEGGGVQQGIKAQPFRENWPSIPRPHDVFSSRARYPRVAERYIRNMPAMNTAQSQDGDKIELETMRREDDVENSETPSNTDAETAVSIDREDAQGLGDSNWDNDPYNPYNWSNKKKLRQLFMLSTAAFTA